MRLRAIRRLQEAFFPLDAIAVELERRSLAEIERIADGKEMPTSAACTRRRPRRSRRAASRLRTIDRARRSLARPSRMFRRIELAPGVELSVADDAPRRVADAGRARS